MHIILKKRASDSSASSPLAWNEALSLHVADTTEILTASIGAFLTLKKAEATA